MQNCYCEMFDFDTPSDDFYCREGRKWTVKKMAEVRICDFCKKRKAEHNFRVEQKRIIYDAQRDRHFSTYEHIDVCNKCYKTLLKEIKSDDDEKDNILVTNIKNDFRNEAAKFFTINENEEHIVVYETICGIFDKVVDKYFKS